MPDSQADPTQQLFLNAIEQQKQLNLQAIANMEQRNDEILSGLHRLTEQHIAAAEIDGWRFVSAAMKADDEFRQQVVADATEVLQARGIIPKEEHSDGDQSETAAANTPG